MHPIMELKTQEILNGILKINNRKTNFDMHTEDLINKFHILQTGRH